MNAKVRVIFGIDLVNFRCLEGASSDMKHGIPACSIDLSLLVPARFPFPLIEAPPFIMADRP